MTSMPESGGAHTAGQLEVLASGMKGGNVRAIVGVRDITGYAYPVAHCLQGRAGDADAARLALCWNSHDALVEALKLARAWIVQAKLDGSRQASFATEGAIRAALAAAGAA